jgi:hypothetical protein
MASVGIALEAAEQAERNALQVGLFDMGGAQEQALKMIETAPWSERERLLNEKQALGFFLSGHPYNEIRAELSAFIRRPLASLEPQKEPLLLSCASCWRPIATGPARCACATAMRRPSASCRWGSRGGCASTTICCPACSSGCRRRTSRWSTSNRLMD